MAREKKPIHNVQMTDVKRNIFQMFLQEYDIESVQDILAIFQNICGKRNTRFPLAIPHPQTSACPPH